MLGVTNPSPFWDGSQLQTEDMTAAYKGVDQFDDLSLGHLL